MNRRSSILIPLERGRIGKEGLVPRGVEVESLVVDGMLLSTDRVGSAVCLCLSASLDASLSEIGMELKGTRCIF